MTEKSIQTQFALLIYGIEDLEFAEMLKLRKFGFVMRMPNGLLQNLQQKII